MVSTSPARLQVLCYFYENSKAPGTPAKIVACQEVIAGLRTVKEPEVAGQLCQCIEVSSAILTSYFVGWRSLRASGRR